MAVFRERLAYVRWLRYPRDREAFNDRELAERAGVAYDWMAKWKKRDDAPDHRGFASALAAALDVSERWLYDGLGEPPEPAMWARWTGTAEASAPPGPVTKRPIQVDGVPITAADVKTRRSATSADAAAAKRGGRPRTGERGA